jgi:hypothetical protein
MINLPLYDALTMIGDQGESAEVGAGKAIVIRNVEMAGLADRASTNALYSGQIFLTTPKFPRSFLDLKPPPSHNGLPLLCEQFRTRSG